MIKSHIDRVIRIFSQNRLYAVINMSVLAIGISSCMLVILYVFHQSTFDAHHRNADRIFRLATHITMGKGGGKTPQTPIHLGPILKQQELYVENYVRFHPFNFEGFKIQFEDRVFKETGIFGAEPNVFQVFTHNMIVGQPETALKEPKSIVLTERLAKKYFGTTACLAKTIKVDEQEYSVTGVIEDLPTNSDLQFQALISYDFGSSEDWGDIKYLTYVMIKNQVDASKLERSLTHIEDAYIRPYCKASKIDIQLDLFATPLREVHFLRGMIYDTPKGNYLYVYIFLAIGFFLLSIACFNYINLAAVQSFKRSKEVAVKGVFGAKRWHIIQQFVIESLILTLMSSAVSLVLISIALPYFNTLAQVAITFSALFHWKSLLMLAFVLLTLGVVSAVVPALYLTSFALPKILKGKLPNFNGGFLYRGLLVAQFAMSIIMVSSTFAVYTQMKYMKRKSLGFEKDKIIVIHLPDDMDFNDNSALKKDLLQYNSMMVSLAGDNSIPGSPSIEKSEAFIEMENEQGVTDVFNSIGIDENYLELLGIQLVAGRNFSFEEGTAHKNAFIVNEAFVKHVGWKDPINKKVEFHNGGVVIGVVKNYNYKSLHNKVEPLIMHYNIGGHNNEMLVKISLKSDLELIEKTWKRHTSTDPLQFSFLDQSFNRQYRQEKATMTLFLLFTVLVIILTCLGLFGLSSLIAKQRVKEIGIRKVLGGTTINIVYVLLKDIIVLLFISIFIAAPIAHYGISLWQRDFAYQADIGISMYLLAWVLTLSTTLLTAVYHTFRAVRTNPAVAIRQE